MARNIGGSSGHQVVRDRRAEEIDVIGVDVVELMAAVPVVEGLPMSVFLAHVLVNRGR